MDSFGPTIAQLRFGSLDGLFTALCRTFTKYFKATSSEVAKVPNRIPNTAFLDVLSIIGHLMGEDTAKMTNFYNSIYGYREQTD